MFNIHKFDHAGIGVNDLDKSVEWYKRVLHLTPRREDSWGPYPVMMLCDNLSGLALFPSDKVPLNHGGLPHFAFEVDAINFIEAKKHLDQEGVPWQWKDHKVAQSIYFTDPDDHRLEITCYEIENLNHPAIKSASNDV